MYATTLGPLFVSALATAASGLLIETVGWEWIFYGTGALGVAWYSVWLFALPAAAQTPSPIPTPQRISVAPGQHADVPLAIGLAVAVTGNLWGFHTMRSGIALYLNDIFEICEARVRKRQMSILVSS